MKRNLLRCQGIGLVEALIYVALLELVLVGAMTFTSSTLVGWRNFKIRENVEAAGTNAMREILRQAQQSQKAYISTSVFENAAGQLSIKTQSGAPAGDTTTYQDFYIDNTVLYQKIEGQNPQPLIPDQVEALSLLVHQVDASVQLELTLRSRASRVPGGKFQQIFVSSATPRGY